jgi:hypothetical protein
MPRFEELSREEIGQLHAFIRAEARMAIAKGKQQRSAEPR